jgi:fumarylpyruvate hydrolase
MSARLHYAIDPPEISFLPVEGTEAVFPVGRIFCVGRNYAAHAIEMGHDPDKEPPFFFMKPADSIVRPGGDFAYPPGSSNVHHEIELVVALARGGTDIATQDALSHVFGYGVGLDMTRRDLQAEAKQLSRPWEVSKAFAQSAPISALSRAADMGHPAEGAIALKVNGAVTQQGDLNQLIWKVPEVISHLSRLFSLKAGDLIMTGTPAGVGPVARGDRMDGRIEGVGEISVTVR